MLFLMTKVHSSFIALWNFPVCFAAQVLIQMCDCMRTIQRKYTHALNI